MSVEQRTRPGQTHAVRRRTPSATSTLAAALSAWSPAFVPSLADRSAQLGEVAGILRAHMGSAAAQHVAAAFEQWLTGGGDLRCLLGVKTKRGGASEVPATRTRRLARDDAVRELAETLPGKRTARAKMLAAMLQARDPRVLAITQTTAALPSSEAQLIRILREA